MNLEEFSRWKQKTVIGASLTVQTPTGQYDGARLINVGQSRWWFKPELGLSRRRGHWVLDTYASVWFYTSNDDFFSSAPGSTGPNRQTQASMGAVEAHLSYDIKPKMWVSVDGNYWYGGKTSLNGVETPTTLQANSRLGATAAIPITAHQSLKFSYSGGTYTTFGGNFQSGISRVAILLVGPSQLTCSPAIKDVQVSEYWRRPVRRHPELAAPYIR